MPEQLWHPIPGRLQSVSVADKAHIWGVTLDLQLAKFNSTTQQWQLVSVTTEAANQNRYSSSSSHSANTFGSNASFGSVSGRASKTIAALLPSFGMGSASSSSSLSVNVARSSMGSRPTSASTSGEPSPAFDGSFMSPRTGGGGGGSGVGEEDEDTDSTVQVSAAVDGTVVRLDKTLKAWYLIAPQSSEESGVDFGRDVIWIELGHFWKCVSVASISQIWGLSDGGDIYYGSSDRFVQLEAAVTSGAGYGQPQFTHISVGLDNTVLATDAHTGTVFRLKKSDAPVQQQSHPPLWTALTGTGPRGLHIANCSLSTSDFVVGVARDGRCYRFSNGHWTTMGGGAKIDNVGVGADGYVIGVDRDGDLFGFQLERLIVPARTVPKAVATKGKIGDDNNNSYFSSKQEYEAMEMPKTPTQQKSFFRRPMASPRELFEMAAGDRGKSSEKLVLGGAAAATAAIAAGRSSMETSHAPRGNAYSRYTIVRSESTMSKRSYASDIGSGRTTPNGLNIIHHPSEEPSPPVPEESPGASSGSESLDMLSPHPKSPLRIQTKRTGDSYFEPRSDIEQLKSPASGFPVDGNPYTSTCSLASSQNNSRNPSPASSTQTPMASNHTIGASSLSNDFTKELSPSKGNHNYKQELSDSDDSVDLAKVQRIHALALARMAGEKPSQDNDQLDTGSVQQGDSTKRLTPPPEAKPRSSEPEKGPGEKEEVLSMLPTEPENIRPELFVVTRFDTERGINVITGGGDGHDAQENHNVDTHLHTPPMTTPEEGKKQPFATSSKETDLLSGGEWSSSLGRSGDGFGEGHGRRDSLRVEMNLVELVAGEKHPVEYKRRPFRPSIDEGSTYQQTSPQSSEVQQYPIFSSTLFPEKEKEYTGFTLTEPKHLSLQEDHTRYYQAPGLSPHRSSSSSDELLQQQQEFLRAARLRSESFYNNTINNTNNSSLGKSEVFENIKEEAPPSPIPLQSFSLTSSKTELDPYSEHPLAYSPGQHQFYQQEPKEEYHPFDFTSLVSPSVNYNDSIDNINMSGDRTIAPNITAQVTSLPQQHEQLPLQERMQQLQTQQPPPRPQPPIPAYIPPQQGRDNDKDTDEAASRPSYSSSHLQHYVDTTMVYHGGLASAERRQSQQYSQLRQRNGGVGGLTSQGGIQGEDVHGRWIGGADPSEVRRWSPDDVHKNKCCMIL